MTYTKTMRAISAAAGLAVVAGMVGSYLAAPARQRLETIDAIAASAVDLNQDGQGAEIREGSFVHVVGVPRASAQIKDDVTGVARDVLVLRRQSKILQWVDGNGRPRIEWSDAPVDATRFRNNGDARYFNAGRVELPTTDFVAPLEIAGRPLSARFMEAVWETTSVPLVQADLDAMPAVVRDRFEIRKGDLFTKGNAVNGSQWTSYSAKRARQMSMVGVMHGGRIDPIDLGDGRKFAKMGVHPTSALMAEARASASFDKSVIELCAGAAGAIGFAFAATTFIDERKSRPKPAKPEIIWGRG